MTITQCSLSTLCCVEAALVTSGSLVPGPGPDAEVCGVWSVGPVSCRPAPPRPARPLSCLRLRGAGLIISLHWCAACRLWSQHQ